MKHPEYSSYEAQDAFERIKSTIISEVEGTRGLPKQIETDLASIKAVLDAVSHADRYNMYVNAMSLISPRPGLVEEIGQDLIKGVGIPGVALVKVAIT